MNDEILDLIEERGGAVGCDDLAEVLDVSVDVVRQWARDNGVAVVGAVYAFDSEHAGALVDFLESEDDDDEEVDIDDEDAEDDDDDDDDDDDEAGVDVVEVLD